MKKDNRNTIQIVGIPDGEEKGKGEKHKIGEIIGKNFPTHWKEAAA